MGDQQRGQRLSPELILAVGPTIPFAPKVVKVLFGICLIFAGCVIGWALNKFSLLAVSVSISAGFICAWRSNGARLLWLCSETSGEPRKMPRIFKRGIPNRRVKPVLVPASALEPGDWVCDYEVHQAWLRDIDRGNQQAYDDIAGSISGYLDAEPQAPRHPEPEMEFYQLVAILPSPEGVLLELGLANVEPARVSINRMYYRYSGRVIKLPSPHPSGVVAVLAGMLPRDMSVTQERDLVQSLISEGYTESATCNAIRAALDARLIAREHATGWAVKATLGIFRPEAIAYGHKSCLIKMTSLGRIWTEAGDLKYRTQPVHQEFIMGDKYEFGDAGAVGPGARAGNVSFNQTWQHFQIDNPQVLANELTYILEALQTNAASTEPHLTAISEVKSAKAAVEAGDAGMAMAHLARAGRWALNAATTIGATVAAAAIQRALGI